jgi:mannose-6-phosphate isomerase-like protein (cupin superfamily)
MPGFTVVNLKEVEDQAPGFGLSPNLEARFAGQALGLERSGVSYQRLAPGFRLPWGHRQRSQEEVYVLVGGSARAKLDGEVVELRAWDALRVPPETMRSFEAGPEGCELLAFGAPKTGTSVADDVETTWGWWSD